MVNWGILGAGKIAAQFVHDIVLSNKQSKNTHVIASVGSSSTDKAQQFLDKLEVAGNNQGVEPQAQSYDDFFANPNVDIVYVATPHSLHKEQVLRALGAGKHVLCEKPFTVTGQETAEILEAARGKNLFVMEAVWTRFFPIVKTIHRLLYEDKVIGPVHRMNADFSIALDVASLPLLSRARDISLAAGATLDIGIYTLTWMRIILGTSEPFEVKLFLTLDPTDGVDHVASYIVKYAGGAQAVLTTSNHTEGPQPFLRVEGTNGTLEVSGRHAAQPKTVRVVKDGKCVFEANDEVVVAGYNGFINEANAAADAIASGATECLTMPWKETQLMMDTMDKIRWENGFHYANESK